MSEFLQNKDYRINKMLNIIDELKKTSSVESLMDKHKDFLENVTPHDILNLETHFIESGISVAMIKAHIEKQLAVFSLGLNKYKWKKPDNHEDHPINHYMQENKIVNDYLDELKKEMNEYQKEKNEENFNRILEIIKILPKFESHYVRKENIIFPYMEKIGYEKPMGVMWSIDDDVRRLWKNLNDSLSNKKYLSSEDVNNLKTLIILMKGMIFKEDKIVFPVAKDVLIKKDWEEISKQSIEEGYSFITPPQTNSAITKEEIDESILNNGLIKLENTGELSVDQIVMMLNTLPVDITYVDENERVRYYSNAKDRIFPRSPAIVGRKVQNCHPPESVHMVEQVIQELKDGKESIDFWINFKGRFIFIRYFAIRDKEGYFKGTLEVSQDLTEARALDGEKRLLDLVSDKVKL